MFKIDWEKTGAVEVPSKDTLHRMVGLAFPTETLSSLEVIEGGCSNINIKIHLLNREMPFILRVYSRDKRAAYREQKLGLLLKDKIPIPYSHYRGEIDNYRFAILDYLPGKTLREFILEHPSSGITYNLMHDVGCILSKISSFEFREAGFFDDNLNVIPESATNVHLIEYTKESLNNRTVKTVLGEATIAEIEACLINFHALLPDPHVRNLVHGDFEPANILVTDIDGCPQISGVLDWEFAFAGSPLMGCC